MAGKSNVLPTKPAPVRVLPSVDDIAKIPLAKCGEYELSDREMAKTRRLIYGINKDKIRRYRTVREGSLLMVWRIK